MFHISTDSDYNSEYWRAYSGGVTDNITTYLASISSIVERASATIERDQFISGEFNLPPTGITGVDWETIDVTAISNYIDSAKDKFLFTRTLNDIDPGTAPTINVPDVVLPRDSTLIDTLKEKLKNNITNDGYGLESADAAGIAERSFDRAASVVSAVSGSMVNILGSGGSFLPAAAVMALSGGAATEEYSKIVAASDRDVAVGANNSYMNDRAATRESGIKLAAWILEEYVKEIEALVFAFEAQVDGYAKKLEGKSLVIKAHYEEYSARVKAFAATADAVAKVSSLAAKNMDTTNRLYKERIVLAVERFKLAINKLVSLDGLYLETANANITSAAAVASAALSQYNASVSSGDSRSVGYSNSSNQQSVMEEDHTAVNRSEFTERINYEADSAPSVTEAPIPG